MGMTFDETLQEHHEMMEQIADEAEKKKRMTFEEAVEENRKMWNWIADETERREHCVHKIDYIEEFGLPRPDHLCFCCQYAMDNSEFDEEEEDRRDCRLCPVDWGVESNDPHGYQCVDGKTAYDRWSSDYKFGHWLLAANDAREIANLPIRRCNQ